MNMNHVVLASCLAWMGSDGAAQDSAARREFSRAAGASRLSPQTRAGLIVGLTVWGAAIVVVSPPGMVIGASVAGTGLWLQIVHRSRELGMFRSALELLTEHPILWTLVGAPALLTGITVSSQAIAAVGGAAMLWTVVSAALAEEKAWTSRDKGSERGVAGGIEAIRRGVVQERDR